MLLHMSMPALSCAEGTLQFCPVHVLVLLLVGSLHRTRTDLWTNVTQGFTGAAWRCILAVLLVYQCDAAEAHLLFESFFTGGGLQLHLFGPMPALPCMSST